jgi:hypothetical protein
MITKEMITAPHDTPDLSPSRKVGQSHFLMATDTSVPPQCRLSPNLGISAKPAAMSPGQLARRQPTSDRASAPEQNQRPTAERGHQRARHRRRAAAVRTHNSWRHPGYKTIICPSADREGLFGIAVKVAGA